VTRLTAEEPWTETAAWALPLVHRATTLLAAGADVDRVAAEVEWSRRTVQRQSNVHAATLTVRTMRCPEQIGQARQGFAQLTS
jgi:hypothetical protein